MSILITGGAGFIGRHTAKCLHAAHREVVVLDHLSTGRHPNPAWATFFQGDIADTALVRRILRDHGVTAVIHLAASAHVGDSMANPAPYYANNVSGTVSLLEAMIAEDVRKLVFASSCSVYGNSSSLAAHEDELVTPMSPYGESKLVAERALRWYARAYGLDWVALRYFNVAGAEEGLGEDVAVSRRIIPRTVNAATGGGPLLRVFGTAFDTPDGSAVRDFVHVSDAARANLLALRYVEQASPPSVINIAAGVGVSVLQIVAAVAAQTGRPVPHRLEAPLPGDPACAIADISRARELLGWTPTASALDTIVASVLPSRR
jgi:UDP-glucose-4-epimerase GalE